MKRYKTLIIGLQAKKFSQRGFTVLELVIYMGLLTVLLAVLVSIFGSALDATLESQGNASVQQDGRYVLAKLSSDVHQASVVNIPSLGISGNSLQLTINGITNTYALTNGTLFLTNDQGTNALTGYDATISNLSFRQVGNASGKPMVQVQFTVTGKAQRRAAIETAQFQTTISTR